MRQSAHLLPALMVATVVSLAACGGTWEDDAGNWERAFGSARPDTVEVIHSKYWRSGHWTNEFQYFFEIAKNDSFKGQIVADRKLRRLSASDAEKVSADLVGDVPNWFAPPGANNYEVWSSESTDGDRVLLFCDSKTGLLFLTDSVV